jgi:hypothetical protein
MVTSAARLLAWYRLSCAKPANSEVAMDGYKLRRWETRVYLLEACLLEHVVAGKVPFNKLIGAFEMYQ